VHGGRVCRDLELVEQEVAQFGRHGAVDRDRDQVTAAAALERALVEQHEILASSLISRRCPDQPEHRLLDHLVAGNSAAGRCRPDPRVREEADRSARQADESGRPAAAAAAAPSAAGDPRGAAASGWSRSRRGKEGKGMRRIDGERPSGSGKTWSMKYWSSHERSVSVSSPAR